MISGRSRKSLVQDGPLRAYLSRQAPQPGYGLLLGQVRRQAQVRLSGPLPSGFGVGFTAAQAHLNGKTRLI